MTCGCDRITTLYDRKCSYLAKDHSRQSAAFPDRLFFMQIIVDICILGMDSTANCSVGHKSVIYKFIATSLKADISVLGLDS